MASRFFKKRENPDSNFNMNPFEKQHDFMEDLEENPVQFIGKNDEEKKKEINWKTKLDSVSEKVNFTFSPNTTQDHIEALRGFKRDLNNSQKSGHKGLAFLSKKNSNEYEGVGRSLDAIINLMDKPFTSDVEVNEQKLLEVAVHYNNLVDKCQVYLAKKGGKSESAQARKEKVGQIMEMAKVDRCAIMDKVSSIKSLTPEQQETLNWNDILHVGREESIKVSDMSQLIRLGDAGKVDRSYMLNGIGVFTKENIDNGSGVTTDTTSMSREQREAFQKTERNITGRNVATSRVAKLIGAEDILAESKTVSVKDEKNNNVIRGNLMDIAEGEQGDTVLNRKKREVLKSSNLKERAKMAQEGLAPSLQKELTTLQVLDYLCGQGDRNHKNYFLNTDENGQLGHVKGIDNDYCFGPEFDDAKALDATDDSSSKFQVWKQALVIDGDDNLVIPHMDEKLAKRIEALKVGDLKFMLRDVIEPDAIEIAGKRLEKLQTAIRKERTKVDSDKFVGENGWGKQTHKNLINGSAALRSIMKKIDSEGDDAVLDKDEVLSIGEQGDKYSKIWSGNNYYARIVFEMMGASADKPFDYRKIKISGAKK